MHVASLTGHFLSPPCGLGTQCPALPVPPTPKLRLPVRSLQAVLARPPPASRLRRENRPRLLQAAVCLFSLCEPRERPGLDRGAGRGRWGAGGRPGTGHVSLVCAVRAGFLRSGFP